MASQRNNRTGHLNFDMKTTIWWEPRCPNVIKICTGDPRFVNDQGGKPGPVDPDQAVRAQSQELEPARPGPGRRGPACTAADDLR